MAENGSNSPAFTPPAQYSKITDNDPQIVRVDLTEVGISNRKSAQAGLMQNNSMTVKHIPNGN
jgi:hypothetical protein